MACMSVVNSAGGVWTNHPHSKSGVLKSHKKLNRAVCMSDLVGSLGTVVHVAGGVV